MSRNRIYPKSLLELDPAYAIVDDLGVHTITIEFKQKYRFTGEKDHNGLRRIIRIKDGLVGGWIMSERNLSQHGDCFIYDNAKVFGHAYITDHVMITDNATISGAVTIGGGIIVRGNACICGSFNMSGLQIIGGDAHIFTPRMLGDYIALQGTVDEENKPEVLSLQELF